MAMARSGAVAGMACLAGALLAACSSGTASTSAQAGTGTGTITVWAHDGQPSENEAIQEAVSEFNNAHTGVSVKLTLLPANTYTQTITSTPRGQLPDVFEFDGPTMASYVFARKLSPLNGLVGQATLADQTSSVTAQDTYAGNRYGVSIIDSGLGLYGNKKLLAAAGVKYPTTWQDAWTAGQFTGVLAQLATRTPGHKALDIGENSLAGEWPSYAFLPIVNSTGNVVVQDNTAQGHLNNPAVIAALKTFVSWQGYIDPNTDNNAFVSGRVALTWVGHWMYPTFHQALGDNLVVLPLPNFGDGAKTGEGSWAWGISATSKNGNADGKFLSYLTSDKIVSAYTTADGAPPGTNSVMATDPLYRSGGPLNLYAQALLHSCGSGAPTPGCVATPRPVTPAYPVITVQFATVIENALKGGNVSTLLNQAVSAIDRAYQENNDYSLK